MLKYTYLHTHSRDYKKSKELDDIISKSLIEVKER